MGDRLYLGSVRKYSGPISPITSDWEHVSGSFTPHTRNLHRFQDHVEQLTTYAANYDAADHLVEQDALVARFVSPILDPQAIPAQQITLTVRGSEQVATNQLHIAWTLFLIHATTGAVLSSGTLISFRRDNTELEAERLTSRFDRPTSTAIALGVIPLAGARLVLELGFGNPSSFPPTNTVAIEGHNASLSLGSSAATDLALSDSDTSASNPWLEFATTTLLWNNPVMPELRLTQDTFEGLYDDGTTGTGTLRLTQDTFEGLADIGPGATGTLRLTQDTFEGLYDEVIDTIPTLRFTSDTFEGLWDEGEDEPEAPPEPVDACPDGQITTSGMVAGQITFTRLEEGLISSAGMRAGQVNCD